MYKDPTTDLKELNAKLGAQRNVRKTLWKQPNLLQFQSRLKQKGPILTDMVEDEQEGDDSDGANDEEPDGNDREDL